MICDKIVRYDTSGINYFSKENTSSWYSFCFKIKSNRPKYHEFTLHINMDSNTKTQPVSRISHWNSRKMIFMNLSDSSLYFEIITIFEKSQDCMLRTLYCLMWWPIYVTHIFTTYDIRDISCCWSYFPLNVSWKWFLYGDQVPTTIIFFWP